ncbi:MAG: hypothetical protein IH614_04335 [Desulfuromonadales bacterium]|nr:hypothetical protein [Desulfuromonadales bacterium]
MNDHGDLMAFNVHAELYENEFGELAIRFEGEKVYRGMGDDENARFQDDARQVVEAGIIPANWKAMPAHELLYGRGWQHVSSMGFLEGETGRPAMELEVAPEELGETARRYLADALQQ